MSEAKMSESLVNVINSIRDDVKNENNGVLSPEFLILGMVNHSESFNFILSDLKINTMNLKSDLISYIKSSRIDKSNEMHDDESESLKRAITLDKVISRTIMKSMEVKNNQKIEFNEIDLLITILEFNHLKVTEILANNNITIDEVVNHEESMSRETYQEERSGGQSSTLNQLLKNFVTDLTEVARSGKLSPMIGRIEEVERIEEILSRKKKNNPIIVGDAGVGKTAIVEGLVQKIISGDVHDSLKNFKVLSLDVNGMIAGTKFRGDLEDRVKKIIDHVSNGETILFIDEIHSIVNAGKSADNGGDIGNTLKPYLSSGKVRCIGATTTDEYRQIFEKNTALSRRFNKVDISELSPAATLNVLNQIKADYEKTHKVKYNDDALSSIVSLSERFLHTKKFPDKAIDILDEAGAFVKLRNDNKVVDINVVEQVISKMAKQPVKDSTVENRVLLSELGSNLNKSIFGQEDAISKMVDAIVLSKSGFGSKDKPIGSYLFIGPTGVGKTELVKQVSTEMSMELLRLDMSEYKEGHSVSKLLGAPAGYVGYGKGGLLTEQVNKNPYSIILLDEFEKAHPDVYNAFLQVFDYGFITDSEGRKVDFRNTIIVMTSNAGIKLNNQEKNGIGFLKSENNSESLINWDIVNKTFKPEFRNRLDGIIEFKPISQEMIINIVNKNLSPIFKKCVDNGYRLEIDKEVIEYMAKKGYVPEMGARPVAKVVKELIAMPLSKLTTFTDIPKDSVLIATLEGEEIKFEVSCKEVKKVKVARKRVSNAEVE